MMLDNEYLDQLFQREGQDAYRHEDYLSERWQAHLRSHLDDAHLTQRPSPSAQTKTPQPPPSPRSVAQNEPSGIKESWRERICGWKYQVADYYSLDHEIVCISMNYLDRYLSRNYVDMDSFLLASVASLNIAIKLYGSKKIPMSCISVMSRGFIKEEGLVAMEVSVLNCLQWHLNPPTSYSFIMELRPALRLYFHDEDLVTDIITMGRCMLENTVCKYQYNCFKPSLISIAALECSMGYLSIPRLTVVRAREELCSVFGENQPNRKELKKCRDMLNSMCFNPSPIDCIR